MVPDRRAALEISVARPWPRRVDYGAQAFFEATSAPVGSFR